MDGKPTFKETVNDAAQTRIVGQAEPEKPNRRGKAASQEEEVSDAKPT